VTAVSFTAGAGAQVKSRRPLFLLALAALPLLVYLPALSNNELIWDSKPMIMENELLQGAFSPLAPFRSGYWSATSQGASSRYDYYRPLTVLSFMIEKAIWGLSPFRLRLVNLLIFIAALFSLYFFLLRQAAPPGLAETAVALYALFPLHLDNINWVVSRCELLMLLFGVLSLLLFDHFLEKRRPWLGLLALTSFALALFSKEAALFFLPLFPLHEYIRRRRLTLPLYILPLLVTAGFWLLKSTVIGRGGFPIRPFPGLWENILPVLGALGYYARSLVFPFLYDMFLPIDAVQTPMYLVAGAGFIFFLALAPLLDRKRAGLLGAWFWIAPFLAGSVLLVFTPIHPFSIFTRYLLLPAIGWTWLLAHGLHALRPALRKAVLAFLLAASAVAVIIHTQNYRSELDFWNRAYRDCPDNSFILDKYAAQLLEEGDYIRSETLLRRALTFKMKISTAGSVALQLSDIAFAKARYEESLDWLEKMAPLELDPLHARHRWHRLLKISLARGELAAAEALINEAAAASGLPTPTSKIELFLAFAEWDKARAAARILSVPLLAEWSRRIQAAESFFSSLGPRRQAEYFIRCGNFGSAWNLWPEKDAPGIPERLQAAKLAILAGHEEEGERRLARLLKEHSANFKVLNSTGGLFFDLHRTGDALGFYQRSLRLQPDQPGLIERMRLIDPLPR
jgi:tetratricopeptide (TPR) repeat protein